MDESNIDTQESAWITSRNRVETEDIILRSPRFSAIERFLVYGGGKPFDMYNRMMEKSFQKPRISLTFWTILKVKQLPIRKPLEQLNNLMGFLVYTIELGIILTKVSVTWFIG